MHVIMDIFFVPEDEPKPEPVKKTPKRLDPIDELRNAAGPITINYDARYQNSNVPFADFNRGDRRWLNLLIEDLSKIAIGSPADAAIMQGRATVKTRFNSKQTWQEFIDGLMQDKVKSGMDFTEGQIKHLRVLVGLLSRGAKLAGCGSLEFQETTTGEILA